jgi:hypothetical protein
MLISCLALQIASGTYTGAQSTWNTQFPLAYVVGLKDLVHSRGGINKMISTDLAGCVQI